MSFQYSLRHKITIPVNKEICHLYRKKLFFFPLLERKENMHFQRKVKVPNAKKVSFLKTVLNLFVQRVRIFSYKLSGNMLPSGVSSLFDRISHEHKTRGASSNKFMCPIHWNSLPSSVHPLSPLSEMGLRGAFWPPIMGLLVMFRVARRAALGLLGDRVFSFSLSLSLFPTP